MNSHQLKVIKILPRCTGGISLLGSSYVSYCVMKTKRKWTVHDRLVLAMSISDMMTSFMFLLGDIPFPKEDGGKGNQMTCNIQGFFIQFVPATVMYNGSLALYYLLFIRYGWKEHQLRKYVEYVIHPFIVAFVFATGIACIRLELFNPALFDCWIIEKPIMCTVDPSVDCIRGYNNASLYQWLFYFGPIYFVLLFSSISMFLVYQAVKRQEQKSSRWNINNNSSALLYLRDDSNNSNNTNSSSNYHYHHRNKTYRHSKRFAVQGMFYIGAFYLTWIIPLVSRLLELANARFSYPLIASTMFLLPLQGFFNCLVYLRPKAMNRYRKKRKKRHKNKNGDNDDDDDGKRISNVTADTSTNRLSLWFKNVGGTTKFHFFSTSGDLGASSRFVQDCDDDRKQQEQEMTTIHNKDIECSFSADNGSDTKHDLTPSQEQQDIGWFTEEEDNRDGNKASFACDMLQEIEEEKEEVGIGIGSQLKVLNDQQ